MRRFCLSLPTCLVAAAALLGGTVSALAHAADRGFVLLLPTGYYLYGGAAAVALSFLILAFVPTAPLLRLADWRLRLGRERNVRNGWRARDVTSLASFLLLAALVAAGWHGSRDPLSNPLPLVIWTLWWVGLTIIQGLIGNVWLWLNPWTGPYRLACALLRRDPHGPGPIRAPAHLAYWPAIPLFFAFALFELVDLAPDDPARLAVAVGLYWIVTFGAMLLSGEEWLRRGECFSVFYGMISRLGIVGADGKVPAISMPGARLIRAPALPVAGILFLLLALASVSFDGLMRTFFWFGLNSLNPLEFEGRSSVVMINTAGLVGMFALLACAFLAAVLLGNRLAGSRQPFAFVAGRLVWSIIPISLAFHFSHYLTSLLVNAQYALVALSDPFWRGWNLFGTADLHVHAAIGVGHEPAWLIWNTQAAAIIGGHLLAVVVAHAIAAQIYETPRKVLLSQFPLAILMVAYTVFGLWLLSTPTAG